MSEPEQLINQWAQVAMMSQTLLEMAQRAEWEQLLSQEESYLNSVESVLHYPPFTLSKASQAIIEKHLKNTLDNELLLKTLLQQRLEALNQLIVQSVRQRSVNTAYGNSGMVLLPETKLAENSPTDNPHH